MTTIYGQTSSMDLYAITDDAVDHITTGAGQKLRYRYVMDGMPIDDSFPVSPAKDERAGLEAPDEILITDQKINLVFCWFPDNPVYRTLGAPSSAGFTRADILDAIGSTFAEIRRIEVTTANEDDEGVFGLSGRDITAFFIEGLTLHRSDDETWLIIGLGT